MATFFPKEAFHAFEERHAESQNCSPYNMRLIIDEGHSADAPSTERMSDFATAQPIQNLKPTLAVQLIAITRLAAHLAQARSPCYKVRRDSRTNHGWRYVPQIEWEFHFDALELWCANRQLPEVLGRQNVLHPATSALVDISTKVHRNKLAPVYNSYEDFNSLSDQQIRRNLVAMRMREWYAVPTNVARVKAWSQKHLLAKHHFLKTWCEVVQKQQCFLTRVDLHYSEPSVGLQGFGCKPSHDMVRRHISNFLAAVKADTSLYHCMCIAHPYVDFHVGWQIPVVALFSRLDVDENHARSQIRRHWETAAGVTGRSIESSLRSLKGLYRFIPPELAMLDDVETHLVRTATYLYDTRLIADTGIDTVAPSSSHLQRFIG